MSNHDPSTNAPLPTVAATSDSEPTFILASESNAKRRAAQGAMVVGVIRARGIPALMPCCRDYPPITPAVSIVMMDLCLATWGGGMKAAGMNELFQSDTAHDFWSLVAHVDSFGVAHLHGWRCRAEMENAHDGAGKTAHTVLLYRAATTWWMHHQPAWHGEREISVDADIHAFARTLMLLLSAEHDLRAPMISQEAILRLTGDHAWLRRNPASSATSLLRERQDLIAKGLEWPLPFQEEANAQYFLTTIDERTRGMTGDTTRIFRRQRIPHNAD